MTPSSVNAPEFNTCPTETLMGLVESAVIERLGRALTLPHQTHPKVEVVAWPTRPDQYKMTHPHGAVLVMYRSSRFAQNGDLSGQVTERLAQFELAIASKTLREPNVKDSPDTAKGLSAYAIMETNLWALAGWTPSGTYVPYGHAHPEYYRELHSDEGVNHEEPTWSCSGPIQWGDEKFDRYGEGVWYFSQRFSVPVINVTGRNCAPGPWVDVCCMDAPPLVRVDLKASTLKEGLTDEAYL